MSTRFSQTDPAQHVGDARTLYERYTTGTRADPNSTFSLVDAAGKLQGPPSIWLLHPTLGLAFERLGHSIRYELSIPRRLQEIVILMVAAHEDSDFERHAHYQAARHVGLTDDEVAAFEDGSFAGEDDAERATVAFARRVLDTGDADDAAWASATAALDQHELFEIIALICWYRQIALQLRVFRVEPPAGSPAAR